MRGALLLVALLACSRNQPSRSATGLTAYEVVKLPAGGHSIVVDNRSDCPAAETDSRDWGFMNANGSGHIYRYRMHGDKCFWQVCAFKSGEDWKEACGCGPDAPGAT